MKVKELIKYLRKNLNPDDVCFTYDTLRGEHNLLTEGKIISKRNGLNVICSFTVSGKRIDY